MFTHRSSVWSLIVLLGLVSLSAGQALTPAEIKEPELRTLQERYFQQLQDIGTGIHEHTFPYPFYLSRVLDLEMSKQRAADQRAIRFDYSGGLTVVELTGNYFAAYSSEVDKNHRVLRTFQDVMTPILEIAMPVLKDNQDVQGVAMEISHHVRGKSMGMSLERPENLVLIMPKDAALRLVTVKSEKDRQAALLDGQFFFNGEPFILYLTDRAAGEAASMQAQSQPPAVDGRDSSRKARSSKPDHAAAIQPFPEAPHPQPPPAPPRDTSPEALARIQSSYQKMIDLVLKELDGQSHFVTYSPPAMIAFRKNAYLEFSINTTLPASAVGSRYRMAALAFDEHIARLVRPVMGYFKGNLEFDGIGFSTAIHLEDKGPVSENNEAVEFFFPVSALRCYENLDCTGQQLIDQGVVLINGERASLDLQNAEAGNR